MNNQPELITEWQLGSSRNELRHSMREKFGGLGDEMRRAGYGALNIGSLTRAMIERFMVKLGKALYYRHNRQIFDGVIYATHISTLEKDCTPDYMGEVLNLAPELAVTQRNQKSLADQFIYRFNASPQIGAVYAVVQFSEQFVFQIMCVSAGMDDRLRAARLLTGETLVTNGRYVCRLPTTEGVH